MEAGSVAGDSNAKKKSEQETNYPTLPGIGPAVARIVGEQNRALKVQNSAAPAEHGQDFYNNLKVLFRFFSSSSYLVEYRRSPTDSPRETSAPHNRQSNKKRKIV